MAKKAIIEIPYAPRYPEVHEALETHRFSVLVAHRRFGKTVLAINHLLKSALLCQLPMGNYGYVAPFRNQAEKNAWKYLKYYSAPIPGRAVNESKLVISLPSGALIRIYGADNPDAIRGDYFDGVIMDEVAQMKPEVWEEIIQPMLMDRKGWAVFIGTPKGVNLFSQLYYNALKFMEDGSPDWTALCYPVTATSALSPEDVERYRNEVSDNTFRQEMLCDFSASADNNFLTQDDVLAAMDRIVDMESQRHYPLIIGVDVARFGNDATVFFARRGRHAYPPRVYHDLSNTEVARQLAGFADEMKPKYICIDQGQGTGVIDVVRELLATSGISVLEIPFGSKALNNAKFANRRAEMWLLMREWLRSGGHIPRDNQLLAELVAPIYFYDNTGRIRLEPKEKIKERLGGISTDLSDALALTFSVPDVSQTAEDWRALRAAPPVYDPFKYKDYTGGNSHIPVYDPFGGKGGRIELNY